MLVASTLIPMDSLIPSRCFPAGLGDLASCPWVSGATFQGQMGNTASGSLSRGCSGMEAQLLCSQGKQNVPHNPPLPGSPLLFAHFPGSFTLISHMHMIMILFLCRKMPLFLGDICGRLEESYIYMHKSIIYTWIKQTWESMTGEFPVKVMSFHCGILSTFCIFKNLKD